VAPIAEQAGQADTEDGAVSQGVSLADGGTAEQFNVNSGCFKNSGNPRFAELASLWRRIRCRHPDL